MLGFAASYAPAVPGRSSRTFAKYMNPLAIIKTVIAAIVAFWANLSDAEKKKIKRAIWAILEPMIRKYYQQKTK